MPHAILLLASTERANPASPPLPEVLPDRVQTQVLDGHNRALTEHDEPVRQIGSPVAHLRGLFRFAQNESVTVLLNDAEGTVSDAAWASIQYHDCTHDPASGIGRGDCSEWTERRVIGTPPTEVR